MTCTTLCMYPIGKGRAIVFQAQVSVVSKSHWWKQLVAVSKKPPLCCLNFNIDQVVDADTRVRCIDYSLNSSTHTSTP